MWNVKLRPGADVEAVMRRLPARRIVQLFPQSDDEELRLLLLVDWDEEERIAADPDVEYVEPSPRRKLIR